MNWWYVVTAVMACGICFGVFQRISELSQRLRRVERKLDAVLTSLNVPHEDVVASPDDWKTPARDPRRKIQAIGAYRRETGVGLAEAKQAVEAWIERGGN